MADPAADLDSSFARLKLSLGGNASDFEDALAAFKEKMLLARRHVAEPPPDTLSALPDDLLIRLLGTAKWEAIAALACVAKRYADVCERAGWACAARRFGRCTNAPFGGDSRVHWTALAWNPFECEATWCHLNPFDEDAFDARGAPPPDDLADAFFWAEFSDGSAPGSGRPNDCLALRAVPRDGRVMRDPDGVLDDRAVGPELVLTGSVKGKGRAWRMAIANDVRIMGALRSRVVVLYAWARPGAGFSQGDEAEWPESWDAENWDETIANLQCPYPANWYNTTGDKNLSATYGMDVPSPHAANALFSVRVHMRGKEEVEDLTIRLKVPMRVWGHVKPWRD